MIAKPKVVRGYHNNWCCFGEGYAGYGATVEAAYRDWETNVMNYERRKQR